MSDMRRSHGGAIRDGDGGGVIRNFVVEYCRRFGDV